MKGYSNSLDISVVSSNLSFIQGVGGKKDQISPWVRLVLLKLVISGGVRVFNGIAHCCNSCSNYQQVCYSAYEL